MLLLAALVVSVTGAPASGTVAWTSVAMSLADQKTALPFTVALNPSNLARVDELLASISVSRGAHMHAAWHVMLARPLRSRRAY